MLPRSFWTDLHRDYWDKKPALFEGILAEPFMSPDEHLRLLQRYAEAAVRGEFTFHRFFADNRLVYGSADKMRFYAPQAESLEEYGTTIIDALGGDRFGIMFGDHEFTAHLEQLAPELVPRVRDFVADLIQLVGVPPGGVNAMPAFGNYLLTPSLAHRDDSHVFTFPVLGKKRFLLWPENYFRDKGVPTMGYLSVCDPRAHIDDAMVVEVGVGDVFYWPPSYWHTAINEEGELAATFTISMSVEADLGRLVSRLVERLVSKRVGREPPNEQWQKTLPAELPPEYQSVADAVADVVASGELVEELKRVHALRFENDGWTSEGQAGLTASKDEYD